MFQANIPNMVVNLLDELVFTKTGQHLDHLQKTIIEETLNDKKYREIAEEYHISDSHVRDTGSKLWKILSEVLGEKVTKSTIRANLKKNSFINNNMGRDLVYLHDIHICTNNLSSPDDKPFQQDNNKPHLDLGHIPDVTNFYGRVTELNTLETWILENQYSLITVLGLSGVGKTALSVKLIDKVKTNFDYIIWRSLDFCPSLDEILNDIIKAINIQLETNQTVKKKLDVLISLMREHKILIVLDNLHSLFSLTKLAGNYQNNSEIYQTFFNLIATINHQSCLILLSQESPIDITLTESKNKSVKTFILDGLGEEARKILQDYELLDQDSWSILIDLFQSNPLWLQLIIPLIQDLFWGKVAEYLQIENIILGENLKVQLSKTITRLTETEKTILMQIAQAEESLSLPYILRKFSLPSANLLDVIHSLMRRLILTQKQENQEMRFSLNPVLKAYVINNLIMI